MIEDNIDEDLYENDPDYIPENDEDVVEVAEYVQGNPQLPSRRTRIKYTAPMINEIRICKNSILHFAEKYFYIVNLDRGREKIKLYPVQKKLLQSMVSNNRFAVCSSRQMGKTTMLTIFSLHFTVFNNDKTVLIVANKENSAQEVMDRIRLAYEQLPIWLKPGVKTWQKTSIEFLNGSRIRISATSTSAGRGLSINCLLVDECAMIQEHQSAEFFKSVLPTISSSKNSKIILSSTPNGQNNYFYKVIKQAQSGNSPWKCMMIPWNLIPGRDEEWRKMAMADCENDPDLFEQEYNCKFLSEGTATIDTDYIELLEQNVQMPSVLISDDFKVWKAPELTHVYSIGVDVSDGIGECASCIQVLDITDLRDIQQVACYNNRFIDPSNFAKTIYEIATMWGKPWILIERNNMGATTVKDLMSEPFFYERVVSYDGTRKPNYKRPGVMSSTNVKYNGVTNMRYYMNTLRAVTLYDADTIKELQTFVKFPNGTFHKQNIAGVYDDRVTSLIWALFILFPEITDGYLNVLEYDKTGRPLKVENSYEVDESEFGLYGGLIIPDKDKSQPPPQGYYGYIPFDAHQNTDQMTYEELLEAGWRRA